MLNYWKDKKYWKLAIGMTLIQFPWLMLLDWRFVFAIPPMAAFNYLFHKTMDNPYKKS